MSNVILFEKISQLPEHLKLEVLDFVEFLAHKNESKIQASANEQIHLKSPKFGFAKGKYIMSPDFDEPLEDFKDYM